MTERMALSKCSFMKFENEAIIHMIYFCKWFDDDILLWCVLRIGCLFECDHLCTKKDDDWSPVSTLDMALPSHFVFSRQAVAGYDGESYSCRFTCT